MSKEGVALAVLVFVVLFCVVGFVMLLQEQIDCHRRGGVYVKGFMTYECLVP